MSVRIQHLNDDASFLLEFRDSSSSTIYRVAIDPWLSGSSTTFHKILSVSMPTTPACVTSLNDLPQPLDAVIISQNMTDHCHKDTLVKLPRHSSTLIFAEPAAAKTILSWNHFKPEKVIALPIFNKTSEVYTIPIVSPAIDMLRLLGQLTVTINEQPIDLAGMHKAVGITYNPFTPIAVEKAPFSPSQISFSSTATLFNPNRPLSILHAPHGISYSSLKPYITYLEENDALPLTAMLHCFDKAYNPWWLGGTVCAGAEGGRELAKRLAPLAWISAHDGDKKLDGLTTKKLKIDKYSKDGVENLLSPLSPTFPKIVYVEAIKLDSGAAVVYSQNSHLEIEEQSRKALTLIGSKSSADNTPKDSLINIEEFYLCLPWTSITSCFPNSVKFW